MYQDLSLEILEVLLPVAVAYLWGKVDVGSSVEEQLGNTHVLIVSSYM